MYDFDHLFKQHQIKKIVQVEITEDPNYELLKQLRKNAIVCSYRTFLLMSDFTDKWTGQLKQIMENAKKEEIHFVLISYRPFIEAQEAVVDSTPIFTNFSVDLSPTGYIMNTDTEKV